jgi:hypothetical protein
MDEGEVARDLGLRAETVAHTLQQVLRELGYESREEAVLWWQRTHASRLGDPAPPHLVRRVFGLAAAGVVLAIVVALTLLLLF